MDIKKVVVIGGGNSGLEAAIDLSMIAKEVEVFEADIDPIQQFLVGRQITPLQEISCQAEQIKEKVIDMPLFQAAPENIAHQEAKPTHYENPSFLAIDIETYNEVMRIDMDKNPILMIALYGRNHQGKTLQKILTYKQFNTKDLDIEHLTSEKEMLERTAELIDEFDPDMLTSYFGDGFDFPYIAKRAEKLGVPFEVGKNKTTIQLPKNKRRARVIGVPHIDSFKFYGFLIDFNNR